jgi:hypothetical protein
MEMTTKNTKGTKQAAAVATDETQIFTDVVEKRGHIWLNRVYREISGLDSRMLA